MSAEEFAAMCAKMDRITTSLYDSGMAVEASAATDAVSLLRAYRATFGVLLPSGAVDARAMEAAEPHNAVKHRARVRL